MDQKSAPPQQPRPNPADLYASEYIKGISDSGWQIHQAHKKGFQAGEVHTLRSQGDALKAFASDPTNDLKDDLRSGIIATAEYFIKISKGEPYAFEKRNQPQDNQRQHKNGDAERQASKAIRGNSTGKGQQVQA